MCRSDTQHQFRERRAFCHSSDSTQAYFSYAGPPPPPPSTGGRKLSPTPIMGPPPMGKRRSTLKSGSSLTQGLPSVPPPPSGGARKVGPPPVGGSKTPPRSTAPVPPPPTSKAAPPPPRQGAEESKPTAPPPAAPAPPRPNQDPPPAPSPASAVDKVPPLPGKSAPGRPAPPRKGPPPLRKSTAVPPPGKPGATATKGKRPPPSPKRSSPIATQRSPSPTKLAKGRRPSIRVAGGSRPPPPRTPSRASSQGSLRATPEHGDRPSSPVRSLPSSSGGKGVVGPQGESRTPPPKSASPKPGSPKSGSPKAGSPKSSSPASQSGTGAGPPKAPPAPKSSPKPPLQPGPAASGGSGKSRRVSWTQRVAPGGTDTGSLSGMEEPAKTTISNISMVTSPTPSPTGGDTAPDSPRAVSVTNVASGMRDPPATLSPTRSSSAKPAKRAKSGKKKKLKKKKSSRGLRSGGDGESEDMESQGSFLRDQQAEEEEFQAMVEAEQAEMAHLMEVQAAASAALAMKRATLYGETVPGSKDEDYALLQQMTLAGMDPLTAASILQTRRATLERSKEAGKRGGAEKASPGLEAPKPSRSEEKVDGPPPVYKAGQTSQAGPPHKTMRKDSPAGSASHAQGNTKQEQPADSAARQKALDSIRAAKSAHPDRGMSHRGGLVAPVESSGSAFGRPAASGGKQGRVTSGQESHSEGGRTAPPARDEAAASPRAGESSGAYRPLPTRAYAHQAASHTDIDEAFSSLQASIAGVDALRAQVLQRLAGRPSTAANATVGRGGAAPKLSAHAYAVPQGGQVARQAGGGGGRVPPPGMSPHGAVPPAMVLITEGGRGSASQSTVVHIGATGISAEAQATLQRLAEDKAAGRLGAVPKGWAGAVPTSSVASGRHVKQTDTQGVHGPQPQETPTSPPPPRDTAPARTPTPAASASPEHENGAAPTAPAPTSPPTTAAPAAAQKQSSASSPGKLPVPPQPKPQQHVAGGVLGKAGGRSCRVPAARGKPPGMSPPNKPSKGLHAGKREVPAAPQASRMVGAPTSPSRGRSPSRGFGRSGSPRSKAFEQGTGPAPTARQLAKSKAQADIAAVAAVARAVSGSAVQVALRRCSLVQEELLVLQAADERLAALQQSAHSAASALAARKAELVALAEEAERHVAQQEAVVREGGARAAAALEAAAGQARRDLEETADAQALLILQRTQGRTNADKRSLVTLLETANALHKAADETQGAQAAHAAQQGRVMSEALRQSVEESKAAWQAGEADLAALAARIEQAYAGHARAVQQLSGVGKKLQQQLTRAESAEAATAAHADEVHQLKARIATTERLVAESLQTSMLSGSEVAGGATFAAAAASSVGEGSLQGSESSDSVSVEGEGAADLERMRQLLTQAAADALASPQAGGIPPGAPLMHGRAAESTSPGSAEEEDAEADLFHTFSALVAEHLTTTAAEAVS